MAFRGKRVNRALEAVEHVFVAFKDDLKTFVILISTNFAACHDRTSFAENPGSIH
jgi:hypothetical protein